MRMCRMRRNESSHARCSPGSVASACRRHTIALYRAYQFRYSSVVIPAVSICRKSVSAWSVSPRPIRTSVSASAAIRSKLCDSPAAGECVEAVDETGGRVEFVGDEDLLQVEQCPNALFVAACGRQVATERRDAPLPSGVVLPAAEHRFVQLVQGAGVCGA